jgi:hypothetical protein
MSKSLNQQNRRRDFLAGVAPAPEAIGLEGTRGRALFALVDAQEQAANLGDTRAMPKLIDAWKRVYDATTVEDVESALNSAGLAA